MFTYFRYLIIQLAQRVILIKSTTKKRIVKKIKYINKNNVKNKQNIIASYKGYLANTNSGSFCYRYKI